MMANKQVLRTFGMFLFLASPASALSSAAPAAQLEARQAVAALGYVFSPAAFLQAIQDGDKIAFDLFLQAGIDAYSPSEAPALARTCQTFDGMARTRVTPLFAAVNAGREDLALKLLEAGAVAETKNTFCSRTDVTPLIAAVDNKLAKTAEALIAKGADVNGTDRDGRSALYYSVNRDGDTTMTELLFKHGAKANGEAGKQCPLCVAAHLGSLKHLELLVKHKADLDFVDPWENTALSGAIFNKKKEAAKFLLANGASVSLATHPGYTYRLLETTLQSGTWDGAEEMLVALKGRGANLDAKDRNGKTLLADAASGDWKESVALLLKHGANPNVKTAEGRTALDYAMDNGRTDIAAMLTAKGAKASGK